MKKILIFIILLVLFYPPQSYAIFKDVENATDSIRPILSPKPQDLGTREKKTSEEKVAGLKNKANQEIERRIASLNGLVNRLNSLKRLSTNESSSFTSEIQVQIASLTQLKNKIGQDSDLTTLKSDIQSIISSYRIYLLYIPKIRIMAAAEVALETANQLSALVDKLQSRINTAESKGKDITNLQTKIDSIKAKLANAQTQAQNAKNLVSSLSPEDYPDNKATLLEAREMIKNAMNDLRSAAKEAKSIIQTLKTQTMQSSTPTASALPTASPIP